MHRALTVLLLLASATAFTPQAQQLKASLKAAKENFAGGLVAGVISIALLPGAAVAAPAPVKALEPTTGLARDSIVLDNYPLERKLTNFGAASYSVFNSITDVGPLGDEFVKFIDKQVKNPDSADLVQKAVDGLLAIPDAKVSEYAGVLKADVYKGVTKDTCVTLGGSEAFREKLQASAAVKSVDAGKMGALAKKFKPANSAVPVGRNGICLPGSIEASEKLWVAQAELTFSMPKPEAKALVESISKAGAQVPRSAIANLVPAAEGVFSKSGEALKMRAAGLDVEPTVIKTVQAALK